MNTDIPLDPDNLNNPGQFASRGGVKLQAALNSFNINVSGHTVLDVGSSTGGFVDCLLQNGAARVYSVDTAYGELAWKLRNDPRVVVMERTNILHLESLPEKVDLITIDASWTKLEKILPIVRNFLGTNGLIIALLKPHYQADQKDLNKGVLPAEISEKIRDRIVVELRMLKFTTERISDSPILGGAGNKEYLLLIRPA